MAVQPGLCETRWEILKTGFPWLHKALIEAAHIQTNNNAFSVDVDDDIYVDAAIIDKLTEGTLGLFLPNLQKAKGSLNEVL